MSSLSNCSFRVINNFTVEPHHFFFGPGIVKSSFPMGSMHHNNDIRNYFIWFSGFVILSIRYSGLLCNGVASTKVLLDSYTQ